MRTDRTLSMQTISINRLFTILVPHLHLGTYIPLLRKLWYVVANLSSRLSILNIYFEHVSTFGGNATLITTFTNEVRRATDVANTIQAGNETTGHTHYIPSYKYNPSLPLVPSLRIQV